MRGPHRCPDNRAGLPYHCETGSPCDLGPKLRGFLAERGASLLSGLGSSLQFSPTRFGPFNLHLDLVKPRRFLPRRSQLIAQGSLFAARRFDPGARSPRARALPLPALPRRPPPLAVVHPVSPIADCISSLIAASWPPSAFACASAAPAAAIEAAALSASSACVASAALALFRNSTILASSSPFCASNSSRSCWRDCRLCSNAPSSACRCSIAVVSCVQPLVESRPSRSGIYRSPETAGRAPRETSQVRTLFAFSSRTRVSSVRSGNLFCPYVVLQRVDFLLDCLAVSNSSCFCSSSASVAAAFAFTACLSAELICALSSSNLACKTAARSAAALAANSKASRWASSSATSAWMIAMNSRPDPEKLLLSSASAVAPAQRIRRPVKAEIALPSPYEARSSNRIPVQSPTQRSSRPGSGSASNCA